jgi:hypothetical protein
MADTTDIIYRVNGQDNIVLVNEQWDRFAAANAGGCGHVISSSPSPSLGFHH